MKGRFRVTFVLIAGLVLLVAGLVGLWTVPGVVQYAFLPSGEKELLTRLEEVRDALEEAASVLTLHGQKTGETLTAGDVSQNDVCVYQTGPDWFQVYPRRFLSGRPLVGLDAERKSEVIVLDEATAFCLFGEEEALGRTVQWNSLKLEVVGVAAHSRRLGESDQYAAWVPLGVGTDSQLLVLSAPAPGDASLLTTFENAAKTAFGDGTLIALPKERTRATMVLRWPALLLALWVLRRGLKALAAYGSKQMALVRAEQERRYALKLMPYAAKELAPVALLGILAVGAGVGLALIAFAPARTFPEWVPESLGDVSAWVSRFWSLTAAAAKPVALKTPELAELRFWGGFVRWGVLLSLLGLVRGLCGKKKA